MRFIKKILNVLFVLSLFVGCQEVYEPEGLDSSEDILVVNGALINSDSLITVTVYTAEAFGEDSYTAVGDASVWLLDDQNNKYEFNMKPKTGYYCLSMSDIELNDNSEYFIRVQTTDGYVYESTPQVFPGEIEINQFSAEIGEEEIENKNDNGDVITAVYEGLTLDISLYSTDDLVRYVRFVDTAIYQSEYQEYSPVVYYRCISKNALSSIPVIGSTIDVDGRQQITNRELGFLQYSRNTDYVSNNSSARVFDTWILLSKAYSVSEDCYTYYEKIIDQVSAQDKIFDPSPTQIIGNMECVTDSSVVVLGFFEVSRLTQTYLAYHWNPDMEVFQTKALSKYDVPGGTGCTSDTTTYEWIEFD